MTRQDQVDAGNSSDLAIRLRAIPAVRELVESPRLAVWEGRVPWTWLVDAARQVLNDYRGQLTNQPSASSVDLDDLARRVVTVLQSRQQPNLRPVINGTGILLHTGLGRAPLAPSAVSAMVDVAKQYANVEMELDSGSRGRRADVVRNLLCDLTGAEAATVVNNNAAAILLVLATVAGRAGDRPRSVIVSRGELIEIGGSFRLPQIMQASGARLCEVGTTNKTRLSDYERAIDVETAALLKVHTSNYRIVGFTESVSIADLVAIGCPHELPVIHDIGSGAMSSLESLALETEPMVSDSIAAGADLVLFSGDKLLGGPQAGLILGSTHWVEQIELNPLMRALRVDKLTLAALEATLRLHHDPKRAKDELPVLTMAGAPMAELKLRADKIAQKLQPLPDNLRVKVLRTTAYWGGGSVPNQGMESISICIRPTQMTETELAERLRRGDQPVISRVQDGAIWFDLRTVFPSQDEILVRAVRTGLGVEGEDPRSECDV